MTKDNAKRTRSIIFTHGDSDGVCSGSIAKSAYPDARLYFTSPVNLYDRLKLAEGFNTVIICDLAIDERTCKQLYHRLEELAKHVELIYIDHHPLPEMNWDAPWFHHDLGSCASELTYRVFKDRLDRDIRRVAIYGAIGDFCDNTPEVAKWLTDWDKRSLYFQAGTLIQALQYIGRDHDFKRSLVNPLSHDVIPSEIPGLLEFAKEASKIEEDLRMRVKEQVMTLNRLAYVVDPKGYLSKAAIYAASYGKKDVGIAAHYRRRRNAYDISIRSRSQVDMNRIIRSVAPEFGGTGGGHPVAAGARIPVDSFDAFIHELDRTIEKSERSTGTI